MYASHVTIGGPPLRVIASNGDDDDDDDDAMMGSQATPTKPNKRMTPIKVRELALEFEPWAAANLSTRV